MENLLYICYSPILCTECCGKCGKCCSYCVQCCVFDTHDKVIDGSVEEKLQILPDVKEMNRCATLQF